MKQLLVIAVCSTLAACSAFRTPYQRPTVDTTANYAHDDTEARALLDRWWENFNDSKLNALIDRALRVNPDLALAALSVRAAALQTHLAITNPAVAAGYTYETSRALNGSAPTTQFHSLTASASYEIDLWGQLAAQRDVARWEERATREDRESSGLFLIGSVVNFYCEIADLNLQIGLGEANIADAQKSLHLVQVLKFAGGATALDVAASKQAFESLKSAQSALIEMRVERRNALTVLLAGSPWSEAQERTGVPHEAPPAVDAGLPATLLDRRPDVRAAELRLRESLAQTDVTRLSFYPNLSLTGSVGTATTGLSELISNPLGSLAAALSLPFIQLNQAHFATALARTQYDQAVLRFKKTLWQALSDVDNALSARTQLEKQSAALARSLESARTTEHLTEIRYRVGAVSLSSWLDAKALRRQAELALEENQWSQAVPRSPCRSKRTAAWQAEQCTSATCAACPILTARSTACSNASSASGCHPRKASNASQRISPCSRAGGNLAGSLPRRAGSPRAIRYREANKAASRRCRLDRKKTWNAVGAGPRRPSSASKPQRRRSVTS